MPRLRTSRTELASLCSGHWPVVTALDAAPIASSTGSMTAPASCMSSILITAQTFIAARNSDYRFSGCTDLDHAKYAPKSALA